MERLDITIFFHENHVLIILLNPSYATSLYSLLAISKLNLYPLSYPVLVVAPADTFRVS